MAFMREEVVLKLCDCYVFYMCFNMCVVMRFYVCLYMWLFMCSFCEFLNETHANNRQVCELSSSNLHQLPVKNFNKNSSKTNNTVTITPPHHTTPPTTPPTTHCLRSQRICALLAKVTMET